MIRIAACSTGYLLAAVLVSAAPLCDADVLGDLKACAAEHDDARRLACFDARIKQDPAIATPSVSGTAPASPTGTTARGASVPSTSGSPTAGISDAALAAPASSAASAENDFGMTPVLQRKENPDPGSRPRDTLTRHVMSVWHRPRGEAVFRLENGQVWAESEGETPIELRAGDTVTIKTGVLGVYWLFVGRGSVRVKRLQ